ncbi:MAG: DNA polymerase IV [Chitinophagaceae bacterium]|nr:DNA polymerase IV [Chitinophagaceae bacterium]
MIVQVVSNKQKNKVILHLDGDAFFVGVEVAKNPKLRGLPVVTGEERGIVSALSYEAKALGIKRGMPIFQVKRNFKKVIILPGDYGAYIRHSLAMFNIVRRYVDEVEEYSIDECFGDLTGLDKPLKMSYRKIAEQIKDEIYTELGFTVSIGIGPSKVLAKVASKWQKPDGLTIIEKDNFRDFLKKTPIEKVWGIGPRTSDFFKKYEVQTALDFVDKELTWIRRNLSKPYETIWNELRGNYILQIDPKPKTVYSSIQKTRTFEKSTNDKVFILSQLSKHVEDACLKARHYNLFPKKLSFFLKTKDFKFKTFSLVLSTSTNAPEILIELVEKNFGEVYSKNIIYRTAGVILQDLFSKDSSQTNLFQSENRADKFETIHKQIDSLEDKFGKRVVYLASTHKALKQKKKGTDSDDLDRNLLFL